MRGMAALPQGNQAWAATGYESGGTIFGSGVSQKNWTPTFWPVGGGILLR